MIIFGSISYCEYWHQDDIGRLEKYLVSWEINTILD